MKSALACPSRAPLSPARPAVHGDHRALALFSGLRAVRYPLARLLLPLGVLLGAATSPVIAAPAASPGSRPNILWVTCEDMSPTLGCYGDTYADTPAIDQLAREGVRYTQAFASAPVCSPVRSGIITGHYATSLGTQRLRSTFPVPADVRPFPEALRHAGYFCANNVKTDYNLYDESAFIRAAWDESSAQAHWRNRPVGRPFFAVVNLMTTHQSRTSVWPVGQFEEEVAFRLKPEERHDPVKAPLPPYYPATAEVRRAVARHYDCVSVMDREVSLLLRQLEEDDLADNTIVFFYSDHGSGLPRGKRVLHDSGLQIPLIIRFPERFRHLAPGAPGTISARLVSTIDLGPTVLALAGLPVAASLQGRPFLGGSATAPRRALFGARDRVDEAFDVSRAVREDHFLYIRNFMPHQSWMPPEAYSDQSPMRRELKRLAAAGELNAAQLTYAAPRRAREELYDTAHDPHQIHNLAGDPEHEGTLLRLRATLQNWILETRDAGFAPEAEAAALTSSAGPPRHWACADEFYPLGQLLAAADLVGRPGAEPVQIALLSASNPCLRYWGAVGLHAAEQISADGRAALHQALADPAPEVRIEAAAALVAQDNSADGLNVLQRELGSDSAEVVLAAARSLELLGDDAAGARSALRHALDLAENRDGDLWMFVRFSLNAALEGR